MSRSYSNIAIDFADQLANLKRRGLVVSDDAGALMQLHSISYFRLDCYMRFFETAPKVVKAGTRLEDVLALYMFDNELKELIYCAIQDIEIALRTRVIHFVSMEQGPFWFMDGAKFGNVGMFNFNLGKLRAELNRSKEDFITEYFADYDSPSMPPAWKTMEVASLGTLSKTYENLNTTPAKKAVAQDFGLPQYRYLESWNRCMTVLRNCCAHHARVWNRRFSNKPVLPMRLPLAWIGNADRVKPHKLYAQLCCLAYMEQTVDPQCGFVRRLKALLRKYPMVDVAAMGFPSGWEEEVLWKTSDEGVTFAKRCKGVLGRFWSLWLKS